MEFLDCFVLELGQCVDFFWFKFDVVKFEKFYVFLFDDEQLFEGFVFDFEFFVVVLFFEKIVIVYYIDGDYVQLL